MKGSRPLALLVEDDPQLRRQVRACLEELGLQVSEAGTGRLAIEALQQTPPDLVVLDLMLPEVSGLEICELIRRAPSPTLRAVPVLITSARALPQDRAEAEVAGANAYLVKPFDERELAEAVRRLMWAGLS
jgi:two-component system chemotaxis response regulator CheY